MLSFQTITPDTLELLQRLTAEPGLSPFRLVGGTALALQYGHRNSVDLDFFTTAPLQHDLLLQLSHKIGQCSILNSSPRILQLIINNIKVDFVSYAPYDWIDNPVIHNNLVLASDKDIAAMKVNAVIGRGTKKDFVDIYALLQHYSLPQILDFYRSKYPDFSDYRALLSLTYFEDAEMQPMPQMFIPDTWEMMKNTIIAGVKKAQM